ncbi:hypothetical protein GCM10020331_006320 [Ectobacillus funiculus]
MQECIDNNDITEYWKVHGEFHDIILYSSGNQRLIDEMKQVYEYLSSLRNFTLVMNKKKRSRYEGTQINYRGF